MSDYWKDFIPAIQKTRLGDCTDSDPQLAAAWLGWQARDKQVAELEQRIKELEQDAKRYEAVARKLICEYMMIRHYQPDQDTKELEQIILNAQLEAIDAAMEKQ
jgi:hypothetical protein